MSLTTSSQLLLAGIVIGSMALPAAAGQRRTTITSDMLGIHQQMRELKAAGASSAVLTRLQARYDTLATELEASTFNIEQRGVRERTHGSAFTYPVPCAGSIASTMNFANNTAAAIPDNNPAGVTRSINVAGLPPEIWDVDVNAMITHTWNSDLRITLQSPAGTLITLSTGNGLGLDGVYNGTKWDDQATNLTTDVVYVNNVAATPLVPEGALGKVYGENPNGVWSFKVVDAVAFDVGSVNSVSLDITTVNTTATYSTTISSSFVSTTIPDADPTGVTQFVPITTSGTCISDVDVQLVILHTRNSDLKITIESPSSTVVTLGTNNGGTNDNVYNGTTWDDDADQVTNLTTDYVYVNNVAATPLVPEGALAKFQGENPNGTWKIKIVDEVVGGLVGAPGGTLVSSTVIVETRLAAECHLVLGSGAGNVPFSNSGFTWETQMARVNTSFPVLMDDIPHFAMPTRHLTPNGLWKADRPVALSAQVVMYNPEVFPNNPTQWSQRMDVYIAPNEQPIVTLHGTLNGIHIGHATFVGPDGRWYIQYPFTIDGM